MRLATPVLFRFLTASLLATCSLFVAAQGSYRAQLRGVVSDTAGAVMPNVAVTITETGTGIVTRARTDEKGEYFFTGLRPSTYSVKVEAPGFRTSERTNVVFAVDQETTSTSPCRQPA